MPRRAWAATVSRGGSPPRVIAVALDQRSILFSVRKHILGCVYALPRSEREKKNEIIKRLRRNDSGDVINAAQLLWQAGGPEVHWGEADLEEPSDETLQTMDETTEALARSLL